MIVTVTLNTAIDHTVVVPEFTPGTLIRSPQAFIGPGGKGTDASFILGTLGIRNRTLGFAAGMFGRKLEEMLSGRGAEVDFVWVAGETRLNTIIALTDGSEQTTLTVDTLEISEADVNALTAKMRGLIPETTCVMIGGSPTPRLPVGTLADLVCLYSGTGIPVLLDASGPALLQAVEARPTVIKPNRHELSQLAGRPLAGPDQIRTAAEEVHKRLGCTVVVTLGADGGLAVSAGESYRVLPIQLDVVSAAGAGDGVAAGLCQYLAEGWPLVEGLRLGFAAAGAVTLTPTTADCRPADVERLKRELQIVPLD